MRNRSQKNAETLLLEPTKNKEKKLPQARQTFAQRKTWKPASHQTKPMKNVLGTRMRKSRTPASFVPKPLRNCSLKNPETLLLEPIKKTFGTHKKQCFGNRCRQPSRKACARCLWRSGSDRLTQRKKSHGGAPSSNTPPFDHNQKSCPSHAKPQGKTFAQRKTWKPASHQQTQEKGVWDAHAKKQNPSRFCAQAIAKLQPEKSRNVAFGTH